MSDEQQPEHTLNSEETPAVEPEVRRPPAPPISSTAEPSVIDDEPSVDTEGEPTTLGANEWLDPSSNRHRRRRHTAPTGPRDRLARKWRRWRRKRRRIAKTAHWYRPRNVALAFALLIVIGVVSVILSTYIKINDVRRAPLIPIATSTPSLGTNIVLLSSNGQPAALALDPKTLVVQFVHISANYQAGQVIDLPNNLVMGSGPSARTIGAIYTSSGVAGLVGALQTDMNLTVNHVIQTSFAGYAKLTNDLGGLALQTETGTQTMTGAQAQAYVDQSSAPEIGLRFQHWSKAMIKGTLQPGVLLNPFKAWSIFSDTTNGIVVDDTLNNSAFIGLVWRLKSLSPSDLHFFTAPNGGSGARNGQPVLLANPVAFGRLSTAIRDDNLATIGLFQ